MKSNQNHHEYDLILSPAAHEDLAGILQYTVAKWGMNQAEDYQCVLDKALTTIQSNPNIGHTRSDIPSSHRAYQAGQHIIVYQVGEKTVYISRVLHGRMDFSRKFK